MSLTILVFGYTAESINNWIQVHEQMIENNNLNYCFAYFDGELGVPNIVDNFLIHKGPLDAFDRIYEALLKIKTQYVQIVASDDILFKAANSEDLKDGEIITGSYYFDDGLNKKLTESNSNHLLITNDTDENLLNFWKPPSPGDNSIFYSTIRIDVLINIFGEYYNKPKFHALDWLLSHKLLSYNKISKSKDLTIIRSRTPIYSYTQKLIDSNKDVQYKYKFDPILKNPIGYVCKLIYDNDIIHRPNICESILIGMTHWINIKIDEINMVENFKLKAIQLNELKEAMYFDIKEYKKFNA